MSRIRLGVVGATGRMGVGVLQLAARDPDVQIVAAVTRPNDPALGEQVERLAGKPVGGERLELRVTDRCAAPCDVLIDFSAPEALRTFANWCAENGCAFVSGTTGLSDADHDLLRSVSQRTPVLWAPNMSLGANLLMRLAAQAAAALGEQYEIEVVETHHSGKKDAPSGTALGILKSICAATHRDPQAVAAFGRPPERPNRMPGQIGVHSLRMGDVIGDHDVHFSTSGETITLRHHATSRMTFAAGALRAAKWIFGRNAGLYSMADVLFAPPAA